MEQTTLANGYEACGDITKQKRIFCRYCEYRFKPGETTCHPCSAVLRQLWDTDDSALTAATVYGMRPRAVAEKLLVAGGFSDAEITAAWERSKLIAKAAARFDNSSSIPGMVTAQLERDGFAKLDIAAGFELYCAQRTARDNARAYYGSPAYGGAR